MTAMANSCHIAISCRHKRSAGCLSESIQHFETDVVSCLGVLGANITKTYNKIFHSLSVITSEQLHHEMHELHELRKQPELQEKRTEDPRTGGHQRRLSDQP